MSVHVYLAGPQRGVPEFNHPALHAAAATLREATYTVFNPAETSTSEHGPLDPTGLTGFEDLDPQRFNTRQALAQATQFICTVSDGIVTLPGWENDPETVALLRLGALMHLTLIEYGTNREITLAMLNATHPGTEAPDSLGETEAAVDEAQVDALVEARLAEVRDQLHAEVAQKQTERDNEFETRVGEEVARLVAEAQARIDSEVQELVQAELDARSQEGSDHEGSEDDFEGRVAAEVEARTQQALADAAEQQNAEFESRVAAEVAIKVELEVADRMAELEAAASSRPQEPVVDVDSDDVSDSESSQEPQGHREVTLVTRPKATTFGERRVVSPTGGMKGVKEARYDMVPPGPLHELAVLYGRGAIKYGDSNWKRGYPWSQSYSALLRHLNAWWSREEDHDPEMGVKHLINVAWHAFNLAWFTENRREYDDRPDGVEDHGETYEGALPTPQWILDLVPDISSAPQLENRDRHVS